MTFLWILRCIYPFTPWFIFNENKELKPWILDSTQTRGGHGTEPENVPYSLLLILQKTDICRHALRAIADSKIRHVYIAGRRGPLQAAFTIKELRELTKLPGVRADVLPEHVKGININGKVIIIYCCSSSLPPPGLYLLPPLPWDSDSIIVVMLVR